MASSSALRPESWQSSLTANSYPKPHCPCLNYMSTVASILYIYIPYRRRTVDLRYETVLSGHAWVRELRNGHPGRIRCELGVSHQVFDLLLSNLRGMGYKDLHHVTLEEQLAIFFVYLCYRSFNPSCRREISASK